MCNIRDGLLISYLYLGGYGGDWNRSSNDSGGRSGWGSSNAYPDQHDYPRQEQQGGGRVDWGRSSNDSGGRGGWRSSNAYPDQHDYPRQQQQQGGGVDWGRFSNDSGGRSGWGSSNAYPDQDDFKRLSCPGCLSTTAAAARWKRRLGSTQ